MKNKTISNNWTKKILIIFFLVFVLGALWSRVWAQSPEEYVQHRELLTYNHDDGLLKYHGVDVFDMTSFIKDGYYFKEFYVQWSTSEFIPEFEIRVPRKRTMEISTESYVGEHYVQVVGVGFFRDSIKNSFTRAQVPLVTYIFTFGP